uniref:Uncharacterized protein n=1 Tax=viral metagenome TaxID=1070528 RepID=A0A6C0KXA4_9ZZZZ
MPWLRIPCITKIYNIDFVVLLDKVITCNVNVFNSFALVQNGKNCVNLGPDSLWNFFGVIRIHIGETHIVYVIHCNFIAVCEFLHFMNFRYERIFGSNLMQFNFKIYFRLRPFRCKQDGLFEHLVCYTIEPIESILDGSNLSI